MAKMKKKWVALCSTAIGAIYLAAYSATETQATLQQPQQQAQAYIQAESSQPPSAQSTGAPGAQAPSTQSPSIQTKSLYKEGTFTGTGSNRRGSIQVAVTIKKDKITDVSISNFAMHYSESDVVGLPDEVLQKQSAQVDNVSGATYSTQAFQDAIQEALSQAQNG